MKKIFFIFILLVLTGCQQRVPEPESVAAQTVINRNVQNDRANFQVSHIVQQNNVYIECRLKNISFSGQKGKQAGKIIVNVNGKRTGEYRTAAFVVKNLPKGNHFLKLNVLSLDDKLLAQKQFFVWVP
ncbi:membrane lipoprotein lipid attachment site-containing protein [Bacillus sp. 2205SS5-2]|uniref:membrane lipoprotein lipid attachment site-containing protein n=1 Tax=Bacillus sp. 2205SS5-2 TaxID=3109031 RepID=UPI0030065CD1